MNIRHLVPFIWRRGMIPVSRTEEHHLSSLQRDFSRLIDDLWGDIRVIPYGSLDTSIGGFNPSVDVKETDKELVVTAELPGLEEKDVEVLLTDGHLAIKGEKKVQKEEKNENYYYCERSFGSFSRIVPLHEGLDTKHVEARFKNGILTVEIPKIEEAAVEKGTKIPIKTA